MDLNTIKKELYKQKPDALFMKAQITKGIGNLVYVTQLLLTDGLTYITFLVPFSELGELPWEAVVEAKSLIRYIVTPETTI